MTDELTLLKTEAAERRNRDLKLDGMLTLWNTWKAAEAALDRAIKLYEVQLTINRQLADHVRSFSNLSDERTHERNQARADVLKLREELERRHRGCGSCRHKLRCDTAAVLADTEHCEQFRQPTEVSNG